MLQIGDQFVSAECFGSNQLDMAWLLQAKVSTIAACRVEPTCTGETFSFRKRGMFLKDKAVGRNQHVILLIFCCLANTSA